VGDAARNDRSPAQPHQPARHQAEDVEVDEEEDLNIETFRR
jgi:hypothetical protein